MGGAVRHADGPGSARGIADGHCKPAEEMCPWKRSSVIAPIVGSLFFPLCRLLGIEPDSRLTPGALKKVVHAGTSAHSFRQAQVDLRELAELSVSSQRVRRLTERIGDERVSQRNEETERFAELTLPEQQSSPNEHYSSMSSPTG